jgi:hypothetical protein
MITIIIVVMTIILNIDVGEEHSGSAFLPNRHCGPTAETARTGCEAPSGLSRTHIFAIKFILPSEQGTPVNIRRHTLSDLL